MNNDKITNELGNQNYFYHHQQHSQQQQHQQQQQQYRYHDQHMTNSRQALGSEIAMTPPESRHNSDNHIETPVLELKQPIFVPSSNSNEPPKYFTDEDLNILKELLPMAETHKWKYIANKVSKSRGKKMNSEFCSARFHEFFNLPQNKSIEETKIQYIKNSNSFYDSGSETTVEGIIGSSLPYLTHSNNNFTDQKNY